MSMLQRWFIEHPRRLDESYFQHQRVALSFALPLLGAAVAAFIHALVPAACERTAGDTIRRLNARLEKRG